MLKFLEPKLVAKLSLERSFPNSIFCSVAVVKQRQYIWYELMTSTSPPTLSSILLQLVGYLDVFSIDSSNSGWLDSPHYISSLSPCVTVSSNINSTVAK